MLELLLIAILGAATLSEKDKPNHEKEVLALLGLGPLEVNFTYTDRGDFLALLRKKGQRFRLGQDHEDITEKVLLAGCRKAGWLTEDMAILFPDGSYLDYAPEVEMDVKTITVKPTRSYDTCIYEITMTVPKRATSSFN